MKKRNQIVNLKLNIADTNIQITIFPSGFHKDINYVSYFHYHTDYEIHFVRSGGFQITTGNRAYVCPENTLLIIPPNTYHVTRTLATGEEICFQCQFEKDTAWNQKLGSAARIVDYQMPEVDFYMRLLDDYVANPSENNYLRLKAILTIMLININDKLDKDENVDRTCEPNRQIDTSVIDNVLLYINMHYDENIRLDDIADTVFLSGRQLARIIKEETGETFLHLLTQYRISVAKKLMDETEDTLDAISGKVGFSTYCGFWKAFCSREGITPSEYKQRR